MCVLACVPASVCPVAEDLGAPKLETHNGLTFEPRLHNAPPAPLAANFFPMVWGARVRGDKDRQFNLLTAHSMACGIPQVRCNNQTDLC